MCASCFSAGPASQAEQPGWLANLQQLKAEWRTKVNYSGGVFSNSQLQWTQTAYIQPQMHPYDRYFYDPTQGYTVDRFLDDLEKRYGGVDAILMWSTYTNYYLE